MAIMQSRRRFVTNLAFAGAAGFGGFGRFKSRWRRKIARRGAAAGNHHDPLRKGPANLHSPRKCCQELLRAEGFTDIRYVDADRSPFTPGRCGQIGRSFRYDRARRGGFRQELCASSRHGDECRRTGHGIERPASRVLRGLREKGDPHPRRPEGQDRGRERLQFCRR